MKKLIFLLSVSLTLCLPAFSQEDDARAEVDSLLTLAVINGRLGNYVEAINIGTEALELCMKTYGKEDAYYAATLSILATYNSCINNYTEAIRLGTELLESCEKIYGKEDEVCATLLGNLADYHSALGEYTEAIRLDTEALHIIEKASGKEHTNYATLLSKMAGYYSAAGNYTEAIDIGNEALDIFGKTLGKESDEYFASLTALIDYYVNIGNYPDAIRLGSEELEIYERELGKEHPDYITLLDNVASFNFSSGNYSEAIRLKTEALEITERLLGKEHPDYATELQNIANYNYYLGNYSEAIRLGTEALKIRERVLGKEHQDYAHSLSSLAECYSIIGNYREAILLGTEAMKIYERVLGNEHPNYAMTLNNLAYYNEAMGNYSEAIRLETEASEIWGKVLGKESSNYATSLRGLAACNTALGFNSEAILLATEALEIDEKVYGKENPEYAHALSQLASVNSNLGNYTEAIRLETEALGIMGSAFGKEHPYYATSLNNLATYNSALGNHAEAIRLETESMTIREKVFGKDNPDYAGSLINLATINMMSGNNTEAIRLGTEALEIQERVLGKEHYGYATSLHNMAVYTFLSNRYDEATQYSISTTQANNNIILRTFADLTASERALFWSKYKDWYEGFLPLFLFYIHNDSLTATAYDGALMSKGLLLNSEMEMSKLLLESGNADVVAKYEELKTNRAVFNKMVENRYANLQAITDSVARAEYKTQLDAKIDSLERRLQMRERELVQESKAYGDYTRNLSIGWREVHKKLGDKDVAIEFLNFGARNDSIRYVALTLTKDDDVPHLIPLFEKSELDSLSKSDYYNTSELADLVWKPLSEVLESKDNIYFAPAGELHNIAIESIPCYDGEGLMSDKWNLYRLSSTRELALIKDKNEMKDAYVYGDLKYDMDVKALEANDKKYGNDNGDGKRSIDWETVNIADSLDLRGAQILTPLPATKEEVESIDRSLKSQHVNSTLFTDTIGTETSFKALTGQRPSVLHIATHGFYWTESDAKKIDLASMAMLNDDSSNKKYVEDKALTRSGLFFAGAANALKKDTKIPEGVDDGILTAKEISVLDLRGLDLVVLSACETGLGEITGDGVFGLQRGFKKAGAQTLLMSLWKVDDNATQMLMSEFYSNLAKGESKFEALKEAQQYVRTTDNGKYSDPRYWAAFILLDATD